MNTDSVEYSLIGHGKPYWDAPFDCNCAVGKTFINFWTASGQCCDNLRLSIWYIFNVVFLILVLIFSIKIYKERKKRKEELEDFTRRNRGENNDHDNSKFFGFLFGQVGAVRRVRLVNLFSCIIKWRK